jgi:photosystem II stability/assembly factor-like uncharacterized protein
MRRTGSFRSGARLARLGLVAVLLLLAGLAAPGAVPPAAAAAAAEAAPVWTPLATPSGDTWTVHDITAFGSAALAIVGDGHAAVSRDAGKTWKTFVPAGHPGTAFTDVAFTTGGAGVIASGGVLLVSEDWGATWGAPAYAGARPASAFNDVAIRGDAAVAVGDGGMIFASRDGGTTWQQEASPVTSDLTAVAVTAGGYAVAGSSAGDVLVRPAAWVVAGFAGAPVTGAATAATPAWGDGRPDLFAATQHDVLGSDDGLTFTSLPGLPDLSTASWGSVAWAGQPDRALLVAGPGQAGFFGAAPSWVSEATGLDGLAGVTASAGQSVAYLLDASGVVARSLSAGREPASATLSKDRITVGSASRLSGTVRVAAPGTLLLRSRGPGKAWTTQRTLAWTTADWGRAVRFDLRPTLTRDYALEFRYGSSVTPLTGALRLTVVPKVTTAKASYTLRRGAVFRFSGTVSPQLKGVRVQLYTDRGGSWRPVSLQPTVKLVDGRTWTSRRFGTPVRETYHLRAHLAGTRTHAEAWSRIVTVTVR